MILSPLKKWEMYVANFIYSFVTGYVQVLIIFFIFRFFVGVDFNGQFMEACLFLLPYVFSIVALSILLTAIVKNVQQFNAVIPIVSVSSAMIGGAYWPLELVESPILLFLAKINPITYGMEDFERCRYIWILFPGTFISNQYSLINGSCHDRDWHSFNGETTWIELKEDDCIK